MREAYRRPLHSQAVLYLAVGTAGFIVDAACYLFFAHILGWPAVPARLAAFAPATVVTWAINRRVTFERHEAPAHAGWQYLHYLAVQGAGIAVNFVVFHSVVSRWPAHDVLALAAGSVAALVFNFAGSRWFVFAGRDASPSMLGVAGFGLLSVALGQDANWDLANYHLYNAYAFLNGRLQVDWVAAGLQTYFNPLLDLPYYGLSMHLPAPAVAFLMGALHGTAFPIVAAIARRVQPQASARELMLLAAAGCLGSTFLSELGSTMGDNTTALLVLGALALCMRPRPGSVAWAGLLVGLATGLKLTNAGFAVALAFALAVQPLPARDRVRLIVLLTATGIAGLALAGGWWHARLWVDFGNPLFPQFNSIFGSPLALPIGAADTRWGPRSALEAVFYPVVALLQPRRLGETPLMRLLWPVAYALLIAYAFTWMRRERRTPAGEGSGPVRALIAFIAVGYLCWLVAFPIGRYLVAAELLLPLAVWVVAKKLWPEHAGMHRAAVAAIAVAVAAGLLPIRTWGHASFAARAYTVPDFAIAQPARATVMFIAQPSAWMAAFLPRELAFVSMFNFPESEGTIERARDVMRRRGGEVWAVLPAAADTPGNTVAKVNEFAGTHGFAATGWPCRALAAWMRQSSRYKAYALQPGSECRFALPPPLRRDLAAGDRAIVSEWAGKLSPRGLAVEPGSCRRITAFIGDEPQPFQLCRATM